MFYKLSHSHRLNIESQGRFVFQHETKSRSKKCNFNTPEIRLRTKTGYIKRVGSLSACLEFQEVPAVMLVHLSGDLSRHYCMTSHQFSTLVFTISRHKCTKCRKAILAYSEQLKQWTAFSPCLYQLVQAGWTMLLMGDTHICSRAYQVNGDTQKECMQTW